MFRWEEHQHTKMQGSGLAKMNWLSYLCITTGGSYYHSNNGYYRFQITNYV
jgi:hypothetical protein